MTNELFEKIEHKSKVNFLHIGKTGGSALTSAIRNHLNTKNYSIRVRGHYVKLAEIPEGEKVFFFLRDPITRFVSGFYSRQRKGRPRNNVEWNKGEEKVFTTFRTPNELAITLSNKSMPNHGLAVQAMNYVIHLSSYYDWFKDIEYFKSRINDILFIGFQETLDNDFEKLKVILGLPASATLPKDDIGAHRNPAHLDTSLSSEAISFLKQWYAPDIELVAICKKIMSNR